MNMYKGSSSPFDYLCWFDEVPLLLGIECKMLRERKGYNPKSLPFSNVSEDQREGLLEFNQKENSKGYLLVNFRYFKGKGRTFAVTIGEFIYLEQSLERKSIPLDYFINNTVELPRLNKGWDLRKLI